MKISVMKKYRGYNCETISLSTRKILVYMESCWEKISKILKVTFIWKKIKNVKKNWKNLYGF